MHDTHESPPQRPTVAQAAPSVLVMGAGSVGCFIGARLQAAGVEVTFVGRPRMVGALRAHGLTLTDLDGGSRRLDAAALTVLEAVPPQARPALVLLTVKSGATREAALALGAALPAATPVVSFQNGVSNPAVGRAAAPQLHWLAGMVPFNVVELGPGQLHRSTGGQLAVQDDPALRGLAAAFERAALPLQFHAELLAVQWAKLLINLNNPVNALSGLPLRVQLMQRGYRRCWAALQTEALAVLRRAGIAPARLTPLAPDRLPAVLRLPTPLFRLVAARMLRIDGKARSSMADDLARRRPTEIDALCGEVVRLAAACGAAAPLNARMVALVQAWPQRPVPMTAADMQSALGL